MRIGSVREIKKFEYRVGLTPDNVKSYVNAGHQVYIERWLGIYDRRLCQSRSHHFGNRTRGLKNCRNDCQGKRTAS